MPSHPMQDQINPSQLNPRRPIAGHITPSPSQAAPVNGAIPFRHML